MDLDSKGKDTAVRVEGLSLERDGRDLFTSMAWTLSSGEMMAVTGPSGVGKSSLLSAITGTLSPKHGSVKLTSGSFGVVFQDLRLTKELSVLTNVLCGRLGKYPWWKTVFGFSADERSVAYQTLSDLNIGGLCHKPVSRISGGEQQRTAIARVLFQQPQLIFADEPTSNLDLTSSEHVMKKLRQECSESGRTAICILHDTELVDRFADVELRLGKTFANGWELRRIDRQA